ncbi:MAG: sugar phosphorylase [Citrobacter sp.]|uniref:sugar phosphorylase n=1 Tax=Citrobacter TaxID=544 RepID=UPI000CDE8548|nr:MULTISPECIES: sugar phosphorylase [Citrobacter]ELK7436427.1 sugar phosphorylase [Citrobacter braakii]MDU3461131.1 sugar phosphorylase [Citrobacter sp.]MDU3478029.1 sugar phosphorylase [Citrobacter sp.]MDU3516552.1 sugar phosphorylase [Citrobacter sp.]MEB2723193.1 sugar phosphorylase [Citrobacter braakii]
MNISPHKAFIRETLTQLYPHADHQEIAAKIEQLAQRWKPKTPTAAALDQSRIWMIAYGDSISAQGANPLSILHQFAKLWLKGTISDIHLLPMFPWTSDDGFSVVDYRQVDPNLGQWSDIAALAGDFNLMFDFVINHISQQSRWFQGYLRGEPRYQNYFINADPDDDYHQVTRPRTLPLLTPFKRATGETAHIWTTFSADQIDLNFREPDVLLESIDILLEYASRGARAIRLDAVGFLWKEKNSRCIHLPQTHLIIKLWRAILEEIWPDCLLITETNVPHQENISYLGCGDEAHMVYQFPLPPLTLHAFLRGNARWLRQWAQRLEQDTFPDNTTFFNFLASHDGIGLRPVENILSTEEKTFLVSEVERKQGRISWRTNPDGSQSPYEMNINFLSALSEPGEAPDTQVARFAAAHAILFMLRGVPAIYYHSLLGSENDIAGLNASGINRRINREKLDFSTLHNTLITPESKQARIYAALTNLLRIRKQHPAFSPFATQRVLELPDALFGVERHHSTEGETVYCVVNVTGLPQSLSLPIGGIDLLSGKAFNGVCELTGWQTVWIRTTTQSEA